MSRPPPTPYPAELRRDALRLLDEGESANSVALTLGLSRRTVQRWAEAEQVELTHRGGRPRRRPQQQ